MRNINDILKHKENRKLEFKRELPVPEKIAKTAIAFSNSQGGDFIIGVSDENEVIGIDENELTRLEETISNAIYDSSQPVIIPDIFSRP